MCDGSAGSLISFGGGSGWVNDNLLGGNARKEAKKARKSQEKFQAEQIAIMKEQLELAKAEDARMQAEHQRKLKLADEAMADAKLTPEELQEGITKASTDVTQAIARRRKGLTDNLARYGINPGSSKFVEMNKDMELGGALADVNARNQTRTYLKEKEKDDIKGARYMSLGIPYSPQSRAITVMGNHANTYGGIAANYGADARYYDQAAQEQLRSTFGTVGSIAGGMSGGAPGGGGGGIPAGGNYYANSYVPPGGAFPPSNMYGAQYYDPNNNPGYY